MRSVRTWTTGRLAPAALAVGVAASALAAAQPTLRVARVLGDHMVLQRDKPAPVWGWADPGEKVTVTFAGQRKTAVAGEDGKWMVVLDRLQLSAKPRTMTVAGTGRIVLSDVLVGDVWLCSGQSNMGRSVDRSVIPKGMTWGHPLIRYWGMGKSEKYPVERFAVEKPEQGTWRICRDEASTRACCAIGFFFARRVQRDVRVPIGILWQAWAGSVIQEWLPRAAWRLEPELGAIADKVDACYPNTPAGRKVWRQRLAEMDEWLTRAERSLSDGSPFPHPQPRMPEPKERDLCGFYNGKIHPIVPFAIKGVLWYQGESDSRNKLWDVELRAMARSWRERFDLRGAGDDIPFYWVQIQRSGDYCSPLIRQEQLDALRLVPNNGMAVLLDLDVNVHPANKVDSGIRLALWALHRDYGVKGIAPSGPLYRRHRVEGDRVVVEFDHADGGLRIGRKDMLAPPKLHAAGALPNVELAGQDGRWHEARAELDGARLLARSAKVPAPLHVRYCYANIPDPPFLYNAAGLPAAAFTTLQR